MSVLQFGAQDLAAIAPEIVLAGVGALIVLLDAFVPSTRRWFATLSLAAVAGSLYFLLRAPPGTTFAGRLDTSALTEAVGLFLGATAAVAILVAKPYLARTGEEKGEFYALLLWGHLGVSLMTRGLDLLTVFIGLETLSLCFYVLAAFFRGIEASSEAGLKYFLTGALGSAFTAYGIVFLFGKSGSVKISSLAQPGLAGDPLVILALLLLLVGFGFKMSLAPFHGWAPDVYQGMPTPAVAFLSVTLGNVVALAQRDVKRLLAYSGIAHMGYVTIALAVFGADSLAAVIVYFFAYLVSNAGAFAAVAALYRDETKPHPIGLLAGEGRRSPFPAAVFALCLFSLAGIPATAGFIGKFFVFKAAVERGLYALAVIGVLNSLISIGYYLKIVYLMYMRDTVEPEGPAPAPIADRLALSLCGAGILVLGIFPAPLWDLARRAAQTLPFASP